MALYMTRTDKQRKRLIGLLEELFQLDQPDLDFGFYKIMHAQAQTVSNFVQKDLLEIIKNAFGEADEAKIEGPRLKYEQAVEQAKSFKVPDPEATEPVREAKAAYDAAKDSDANEGEIYEHLYRFFERYYDNGDFMSRRYFARETGGKAAPYAVPYDGREVYLHWANRDQYYIKTSEYLANATFDIARHFAKGQRVIYNTPDDTLKLHCRIVDAAEGEHNNNKTTDKTERFFLIFSAQPAMMENGELVLQFEYRPDKEKSGQAGKWQEQSIDRAEKEILDALDALTGISKAERKILDALTGISKAERKILDALTGISKAERYNTALRTEIGEDKNKRTLLRKYLNQYTKRNTTDYFIHKDLSGFLSRELDFYIKNEIMRLDDIESADAPHVQAYLYKIKVLRKIAGQLITFLAQLEEFQKKLWLKKKFVTETQYCITLDRIPEEFYAKIAANEEQRHEWVTLFAIDDLDGYSEPLSEDFLKANPFLVLDTALFPVAFKDSLTASMQDLDENMDGLLIHSENTQSIKLIKNKYQKRINYVYADPPYNTNESSFIYKNGYKHSSWGTMLFSSISLSRELLANTGVFSSAIDDLEQPLLTNICDDIFGQRNRLGNLVVEIKPSGRTNDNYFATSHEYVLFYANEFGEPKINFFELSDEQREKYSEGNGDNAFTWRDFLRTGGFSTPEERPNSYYPIYYNIETKEISIKQKGAEDIEILPIDSQGKRRVWRKTQPSFIKHVINNEIKIEQTQKGAWKVKIIDKIKPGIRPKSVWVGSCYDSSSHGTKLLKSIFGETSFFTFPKSINSVKDCIYITTSSQSYVFDGFAGSGTTGHAVVSLNREDNGTRKYIMVEMGNYFDAVTRPRMQKVVYSKDWKDGKPVSRDGISHAFKYIRLESYEDTLNNLSFKENSARDQVLQNNGDFRRDYMLKYWLEFETKDSPSLLNIDQFADPTAYRLKLKKPGSDEYEEKTVDLLETFNWLIGLHVDHLDQWRSYNSGSFKRELDPELPGDDATRLILDGPMEESNDGKWLFRKVKGRVCRTPGDMNNTGRVLVIWRKLTGNLEEDNLILDEWFKKYRLSTQDSEFDVIYVNGSNNLPNLRQDDEQWKVRLIEEAFHQHMWDVEA